MKKQLLYGIFGLSLALLAGCRGYRTENEPFHLNPNFDWQPKYKAQTLSSQPPKGTVPRSTLNEGDETASSMPPVTDEFIRRGQERFNVYCSVCHDRAGSGKGMVVKRGFLPPPNLSEDRIIRYTDQELFTVIANGIRNMPGYAKQIPEKDRWAIIAYVRALQLSQHANVRSSPVSPSANTPEKSSKKEK